MSRRLLRFMLLLSVGVFGHVSPAYPQLLQEETLPNPDAHEQPEVSRGHLFGTWGGVRTSLQDRGVKLDVHYLGDSLWNIKSPQKERLASFNRVRATVDVDLNKLMHAQGLSFHATAVWQAGGVMQSYLGVYVNPGSLASRDTFRLGSWWFEKHWWGDRIATRLGQFAGQDSYGHENFGKSFVFSAQSSALDNLFENYESFDPFSTPAIEIRVAPTHYFYLKSMVQSEDRSPFLNNPTGLVPQFHGTPVSISEVGFTPGKKALAAVPADNTSSREGYSGLYQFGASYNPGTFQTGGSKSESGNYILYGIASQAVWRANTAEAKGIDATFSYDWSRPGINLHYQTLSTGLRFNEPIPLKIHHTLALGYVQTSLSPQFPAPGQAARKVERGFELNTLLHIFSMMYVQPVVQYYANIGGMAHRAVVFGFRTKVEL